MSDIKVGIVGTGIYLPKTIMTAKEIADSTNGNWSEEAVINKLGIKQKPVPGENDGTQEMAVRAAFDCLKNTNMDPLDIDVILCVGEEWKEYPLTTSALYIQDKIGASNAWGIDLQNRCSTTVSTLKIAKDMLVADKNTDTILVVGGYRNGDFVDYQDPNMSMMYNLSAGAGAIILKKGHDRNLLLESHIISDGSMARDAGVEIGGILNPITSDNISIAYKSLKLLQPDHMKQRLNDVSMKNWFKCINLALEKSGVSNKSIDYLAILHFKRSLHNHMINELGLSDKNTIYLEEYGHMGQIDQILSIHLALERDMIKDGSIVSMVAAGIGYVWGANVIRWGKV